MAHGSTVFDITEFGAIAGGTAMCTAAFAAAIEACAAAGGGTIHVPAGSFLTGPIHLRSKVTLHLAAGARLVFSRNKADYPLVETRWEGAECRVYSPQIFGENLEDVAVTGQGILDGRGDYWWRLYREKTLDHPRPRLICFAGCRNVLIEGIKLINSPSWTINPILCENVTIDRVTITNPYDSPNTDGINPDSCRNVHIANCHVDVGDDCLTLKSGTEACRAQVPCQNITVTNCTMVHGHGGVVIGSEMSGDVRNVVIANCVFEETDRGIRIKSRRGRGGIVEDIRVTNVIMRGVICPFVFHQYYHCGAGGHDEQVQDRKPHPVTASTPVFRRIHLSNITAREVGAAAGFLYGLPEMPLEEITFDNIAIQLAEAAEPARPAMMDGLEPMRRRGFVCHNIKNVSFSGVQISGQEGPAFRVEGGQDLKFAGCAAEGVDPTAPVIAMSRAKRVFIHGCQAPPEGGAFLELHGPDNEGIELAGNSAKIEKAGIRLIEGATKDALVR